MVDGIWAIFKPDVLFSVIVGGVITWFFSWYYYVKAGKELLEEAGKLRQLMHAIYGAQLNPRAQLEPVLDEAGNIVSTAVGAVGSAAGIGVAHGVGSTRPRETS